MMVVWKIPWGWFRGTGLRGLWEMSAVKLGAALFPRRPADRLAALFRRDRGIVPVGPGSLCVVL